MTDIPSNHPRLQSLLLRERLIEGLRTGLASEAGLLAHGRGEAFDYLLGERTHAFASEAIEATSARLLTAKHPVFSVNGSAAAVAGPEIADLVRSCDRMIVEVNLFHHTPERSRRIADYLGGLGLPRVVESSSSDSVPLPTVRHARRHMHKEGIAIADVVLVALEDGDRCQALVESGRQVIAIDLNPLSRTARVAHVTIVDEITRALKALKTCMDADRRRTPEVLAERMAHYNNLAILDRAAAAIRGGFSP
jgi:4-phosphopantoate--beta-alanine ligase